MVPSVPTLNAVQARPAGSGLPGLSTAERTGKSTPELDSYGYAKTAAERAVNAFAAASAGCDTHTHTLTAHAHTHAHDTHTNTRTVHTHARFSS